MIGIRGAIASVENSEENKISVIGWNDTTQLCVEWVCSMDAT